MHWRDLRDVPLACHPSRSRRHCPEPLTESCWPSGSRLLPIQTRFPQRGRRVTLTRHFRSQDPNGLLANEVKGHPRVCQHLRRKPLFFSKESEQQMFSAHITVIELARFAHRELEDLF